MSIYYQDDQITLHHGDALDVARELPDGSADCIVTSPPYFALRDYGIEGQYGLEASPSEYVETMRTLFSELRRVLADDGTLWLNIGDSYAANGILTYNNQPNANRDGTKDTAAEAIKAGIERAPIRRTDGIPSKNLLGVPWRTAFALQDDGWILRNAIIWCLSGGAWVYARTTKGDMPVMLKDLVRLDPATVKLWNGEKWTQVLGWGPSTDTSERLELVLRSGERIGCTGGHQWPTQRGLVHARDLQVGDVLQSCRLPEPTTETPPYLTPEVLWLVGFYLAEGSRSGPTLQLSMHANEAKWLPLIAKAVKHLGGTMSHTIAGNGLAVRMWGSVLDATISTYIGGRTARDKHLKVAAWRLPDSSLGDIISGYLDGDAHLDIVNRRWRLGFTRNYALERDLRTAAARLNATLTLKPCMVDKYPSFRGEWRWDARAHHHNNRNRGEIVEIRASRARQFWDIAVEDEPHLFALASGILTHNCKPNAMPESVRDRLSNTHEYVFLFSKSPRYWFDIDPIRESYAPGGEARRKHVFKAANATYQSQLKPGAALRDGGVIPGNPLGRNPGTVWTVATAPFPEAHFAVMPVQLPQRCIAAGCKPGGTVLDPFSGSGTTGLAAQRLGRKYVGIDLNAEYLELSLKTRLLNQTLNFDGETA